MLGGLAAAGAPLTAAAQVDDRPVVAAEAPPFEVLTLAVPTTDRPVGLGDTRSTTTSSPPRDSTTTTAAPRDPPPRDTTTTKPARDRP